MSEQNFINNEFQINHGLLYLIVLHVKVIGLEQASDVAGSVWI